MRSDMEDKFHYVEERPLHLSQEDMMECKRLNFELRADDMRSAVTAYKQRLRDLINTQEINGTIRVHMLYELIDMA